MNTTTMLIEKRWKTVTIGIIVPISIMVVLFLSFSFIVTIPTLEKQLMAGKRHIVVEQVRSVRSLLNTIYLREKSGELTRPDAQKMAIEMFRTIRFGDHDENYLFIADKNFISVMHPLRQELEGHDMSEIKDANGDRYVKKLIETALQKGEGFVQYSWFVKGDATRPALKLSYVTMFKPWGWMVGTGIFIDDIERILAKEKRTIFSFLSVFLLLMLIAASFVVWKGVLSEKRTQITRRQLWESEQRYQAMFSCSRDAMVILVPPKPIVNGAGRASELSDSATLKHGAKKSVTLSGWRFINANDTALKLFGITTLEEFQQLNLSLLWPEVQQNGTLSMERVVTIFHDAMEKGSSFVEWEHRRMDGGTFFATMLATRVDYAGSSFLQATIRDISEAKIAQSRLAESEENLRITLDSIGDAVIATDKNGTITRMNPVACQLTGWSLEEAHSRPLAEIFKIVRGEDHSIAESPVEKVIRTGKIVGLANHTILIDRNGRELQIADSGAPIRDANGAICGVVLVWRDVTEQYHLEEQLRHSQKMDSIGQLAGGIAHDFNNILGGIIGASDLLVEELRDMPKALSFVKIIQKAALQTSSLTNKLLAFSRKGIVQTKPVDLNQIVHDAYNLLKRSIDPRISIELHLTSRPTILLGDPGQLESSVINLCVNARDAMPAGGTISIHTDVIENDKKIDHIKAEKLIALHVSDTGTGIDPTILPRIFDPFFTTKPVGEGTGLGLAAVYGTIHEHGGTIEVESEVGKGTRFHILLPATACMVAETYKGPIPELPKYATILLVEDNEMLSLVNSLMISDMNMKVRVAHDGAEAVSLYKADPTAIDLVILDMTMPRMNGKDAFIAMRKCNPQIKVVLTSGFDLLGVHTDLLKEEGVVGFLKKPFNTEELKRIITTCLTQQVGV